LVDSERDTGIPNNNHITDPQPTQRIFLALSRLLPSCLTTQRRVFAWFHGQLSVYFWFTSPTKANKGITTTVTRLIHRQAIMISMPRIPSQLPKITRATPNTHKTTNQIIPPRATILLTLPTVDHPHQVAPNHIPRLLTLLHRHHRSSISNSSHTIHSPLTNPSAPPNSACHHPR
jgi:hypothetical protein